MGASAGKKYVLSKQEEWMEKIKQHERLKRAGKVRQQSSKKVNPLADDVAKQMHSSKGEDE